LIFETKTIEKKNDIIEREQFKIIKFIQLHVCPFAIEEKKIYQQ
jgi:hypothetical protein